MSRAYEVPTILAENQLVRHLPAWRTAEMVSQESQLSELLTRVEACLDEYQDPELDRRIAHIKELLAAMAAAPTDAPIKPWRPEYRAPRRWHTDDDD